MAFGRPVGHDIDQWKGGHSLDERRGLAGTRLFPVVAGPRFLAHTRIWASAQCPRDISSHISNQSRRSNISQMVTAWRVVIKLYSFRSLVVCRLHFAVFVRIVSSLRNFINNNRPRPTSWPPVSAPSLPWPSAPSRIASPSFPAGRARFASFPFRPSSSGLPKR